VPLALLLIVLAEVAGVRSGAVYALGAVLVVARLASAVGLSRGAGGPRQAGAGLTLLAIAAGAVMLAMRVVPLLGG